MHATAIAVGGRGALIRGASGSGKSDLALRCLAWPGTTLWPEPARLVADDQVELERRGEALFARPPTTIRGLIEVRGLGIVAVPFLCEARLVLVVDLVSSGIAERLPDPPARVLLAGVGLPVLALAPFEASAPVKLLLALSQL